MKTATYRPEIDGLRAIAVLAVIINHIDKTWLPSGHLGVDLFFVISGFVITQSLATKRDKTFGAFILNFYNRRVKRLVPALVLFVGVTCLLSMLFVNPKSSLSVASWQTGVASLFGISNLYLLQQATDYFGTSAELNPFTHTWSLGVEEQFYLIFPLLLWFSGFAQRSEFGIRNFTLTLSLIGTLSLICYFWIGAEDPVFAFYMLPTRFWELSTGSVIYIAWVKVDTTTQRQFQPISALAAILLIGVFFTPQEYSSRATLAIVTLSAVLLLVLRPISPIYRVLTTKFFAFLGTISYSLYLWHWSVLTIGRWTIGLHWWSIPFLLAAIFIFAALSYKFIERPLRQAEWSILRIGKFRLGAIGHAVVATLACISIILALAIPFQGQLFTGNIPSLKMRGIDTLLERQNYSEKYFWEGNKCTLSSNSEVGKVIVPDGCTFGDFESAKRRVLVVGNSFSAAQIEMYKVFVDKNIGSVTMTSAWGASAVPEVENSTPWDEANDYYWETVVPSLVEWLQEGDILLMVNDGASFSPQIRTRAQERDLNDLRAGLARISDGLSQRGIYVIYQNGIPFIRDADCTPDTAISQWWNLNREPPCTYFTKEDSLARRRAYNDVLVGLQSNHPNFFMLDLFDVFCPGEVCKYYNEEGVFLYRDSKSHPSVEASLLAQNVLLEKVRQIIESISKQE